MNERGLFVAIEGGDGSGKGTQAELLREHYSEILGREVLKLSFPRYKQASAYYVEQYLNGNYSENPNDIPADLASLAFAIDRFAVSEDILEYLNKPGGVVIADRYVASNLAHQGAKFTDATERKEYYERMMQTEYEILGIPRPDKNIVLLVPTNIAQSNIDKKPKREYTDRTRDIHEADANHLGLAKANYEELCRLYPDEFISINCMGDDGQMRSKEDVQQEIRTLISNS